VTDGDQPHSNKFIGHSVTLDKGSSSSQALLRPLSMDCRWTQPTDEAEPRMLNRSWSTIPTWDDYEEFKLPKRYQKPTNKINTRLSRTYITVRFTSIALITFLLLLFFSMYYIFTRLPYAKVSPKLVELHCYRYVALISDWLTPQLRTLEKIIHSSGNDCLPHASRGETSYYY